MARTYTIRGKVPSSITHTKIQLSSYDPKVQYQIVDFRIMPAGQTPCDLNAILTINENDAVDPTKRDFAIQNAIGWVRYTAWSNGTALPGAESVQQSYFESFDDRLFNYDIWLHTEDALDNEEINYLIKIYKQDTSAVAGSISSLSQFLAQGAN